MKTTDSPEQRQPGILQALRRMLSNLFCCGGKEENVSDDDIRKSVGGKSATSTHQKPSATDKP